MRQLLRPVPTLAVIALLAALWEAASHWFGVPDYILPSLDSIFSTMTDQWPGTLASATWVTTEEVLLGFALSIAVAAGLAVLLHSSRILRNACYPLLIGFSSIPKVAVVPIFVLWFGSGSVPAILTALSICFFPIVVNIATGLATTEPELEDVLKALGASKFDILWNVGLPRTMPFFFASLKVAVSYAFVGAVLSETVASNSGIGNVLMTASSNFNVPLVFAALFVLAALGVALYVMFSLIEGRVTGWATRKNDLIAT